VKGSSWSRGKEFREGRAARDEVGGREREEPGLNPPAAALPLARGFRRAQSRGTLLAAFERRCRSYREIVSRRTPVSASIRRNVHLATLLELLLGDFPAAV
jgi:hypothetical protein